jgi:hypothetical protein
MYRLDRLAIFLIVFSIIGLGCSFIIPKFKDSKKINELSESFNKGQLIENKYIENYLALTTIKYEVQNISTGLLTFAIVCLLFFKINKIKLLQDFLSLRSMYKYSKYLVTIHLCIILMIGGMIENLIKEDNQYPIYDNSAQAAFGLIFFSIFLLIILNILFHIFIIQKRQQNTLLNIQFKSSKNRINGLAILLIITLFICVFILFIFYGSISGVIASMIFIYILISLLSEINIKTLPNTRS